MATPAPSPEKTRDRVDTVDVLQERYGPAYRWLVTYTGLIGVFAMILTLTLVNVGVPAVRGAFGVSQGEAQWMATAALAAMTASQLLNAWMVTQLGERATFTLLLLTFLAGSCLCAAAPTFELLIVGRILQGAATGLGQPLVMTTILAVFPIEQRGRAMGIFGAGITIAPAIGPFVGGLAIDLLDWRWMFLLPIPATLVALVAGLFFMPERRADGARRSFDWTGYALIIVALILGLTAIANAPDDGWGADSTVLLGTFAILASGAFIGWQAMTGQRLLAIDLFRRPGFAAAGLVAIVFGAGNFGSTYVIPVFVQEVQNFSATEAGLLLMPAGLALVVLLPFTGRLADHLPGHTMIMMGLGFFALGTGLMVMSDSGTPFWTLAFWTLISRVGLAFILPSLSSTALRTLPASDLPRGSGNLNFVRQLGGALGTNLIVVWLQLRTADHSDQVMATQSADNPISRATIDQISRLLEPSGLSEGERDGMAQIMLGDMMQDAALTFGFQDCFLALSVVFLVALIPAYAMGRAAQR